jgi:hypothetical protein
MSAYNTKYELLFLHAVRGKFISNYPSKYSADCAGNLQDYNLAISIGISYILLSGDAALASVPLKGA